VSSPSPERSGAHYRCRTKQSGDVELQKELEQEQIKRKTNGRWKQCFDENSGRVYFYHTKTRETTWDIPDELKTDVEKLAPQDVWLIAMPMALLLMMLQYSTQMSYADEEKEQMMQDYEAVSSEVSATAIFISHLRPNISCSGRSRVEVGRSKRV
jgi:hypothetical protein